jgi:hypothetical protein
MLKGAGHMNEKDLLRRIGLSDSGLRSYLRKLNNFSKSLSAAEQRVFLASLVSAKQALKSFDNTVTAEELEEFIIARAPKSARTVMVIEGVHPHPIPPPSGECDDK